MMVSAITKHWITDAVLKKHTFTNEGQKSFINTFHKKTILLLCPVGVLCSVPRLSDCKLGSLLHICCNSAKRRKYLSLATGKLVPQYDLDDISNKISVFFLIAFIYIKIIVYRINHGLGTEVFSVFDPKCAGNKQCPGG